MNLPILLSGIKDNEVNERTFPPGLFSDTDVVDDSARFSRLE
jgi:hypothetical protein